MPGIQAGRAVAALAVVYFHSYVALPYFDQDKLHTWAWLAKRGAAGVDLFFAISGFIICMVAARPDFTRSDFALRRVLRLYPLNAAVTLFMVLMFAHHIAGDPEELEPLRILRSLLILPQPHPINSVGWTLEYEVMFYLLAAIILPAGGRFALLAYCLAAGTAALWHTPETPLLARFADDHYLDFGAGVAAWIAVSGRDAQWPLSIMLTIAGVGIYVAGTSHDLSTFTPLACGTIVAGLALLPAAPRPLMFLGDISYGVYLLHWPILNVASWLAVHRMMPERDLGEPFRWLVIGSTIALASVSWLLFERPIIRLGRRFNSASIRVEARGVIGPPA